jgi:hypothetical protein
VPAEGHLRVLTVGKLSTSSASTSRNEAEAGTSGKSAIVSKVVYESPLGNLVTRLRTVSLATGICGTLGLPLVVAIKGGDIPSSGLLAFGIAFLTGSLGSTAAIHFVFSPYVYAIERIPVRLCHYKEKKSQEKADQQLQAVQEELDNGSLHEQSPPSQKDFLLKATSRSLFLTQIDTVFNPESDVTEYKGFRPLCNFVAKGRPLYVHAEYLHDAKLRQSMNLVPAAAKDASAIRENPDDFL